jgi:predicted aspartyl protease
MFTRRNITAGLGLSFVTQQALAQKPAPVPPAEAVLILDASLDPDDRLTVAVMLNGLGPFEFIVDSGADRSVLSQSLADRLKLAEGPKVLVHGVGGAQITPTARVEKLTVGDARLSNAILPVLPPDRVGADGLLGVDILQGRNVIMDFRNHKLEVRRSRSPLDLIRLPREVSVVADDRFGRLTVADCKVAGVRALALIDTGGGVSIGNMALSRAIATRRRRFDNAQSAQLITASGEITLGQYRIAPSVTLGELRMTDVPMAFGDVHIFNVWRLIDRPAILLGADILRLFARVELDFGAGRVLFRIGGVGQPKRMNA